MQYNTKVQTKYSLYNQLWATWSVPLNVYSPSAIIAFSLFNSILMARFLKQSFAPTCLKETDNGKLHQFNYWHESTLHTWAGKRAMRRRGSKQVAQSWLYRLYTLLQNKKWRWWAPPPPQPIIFERQNLPPTNLHIIGKGIYRRVWFILDIDKIFWFRDFMSNFREMTPEKISNF